jgi:hypothetical protein
MYDAVKREDEIYKKYGALSDLIASPGFQLLPQDIKDRIVLQLGVLENQCIVAQVTVDRQRRYRGE